VEECAADKAFKGKHIRSNAMIMTKRHPLWLQIMNLPILQIDSPRHTIGK